MRILMTHNYYQQSGGEDAIVAEEYGLLSRNNIKVELYEKRNESINEMTSLQLAMDTLWSRKTIDNISHVIERFKPDVIHTHNTFPLISPSLYYAAARHKIPVVQTLHNFRLFCIQAMFMRGGEVCEDCLGKLAWRGVVHGCYRDSRVQSAVIVGMQGLHRSLGTYQTKVTRYIALNQFCLNKFVEAGLPHERMCIKPNFIDLPEEDNPTDAKHRSGALFVGQLSTGKGIATLAAASDIYQYAQIDVVGIGPQHDLLQGKHNVRLHGWKTPSDIYQHMRKAAYLVLPSIWYENFPRTLVEAFACGLPVIASRMGAMTELIQDKSTGLLFEPGSAQDLAEKMQWADNHPEEMQRMGKEARREYEKKYTAETNLKQLIAVYQEAIVANQIETR